jgi:hypothetical protein
MPRSGCQPEESHHATSGSLAAEFACVRGLARLLSQHRQSGGGVVHVAGRAAVQAAVAFARVGVAGFPSRSRSRSPRTPDSGCRTGGRRCRFPGRSRRTGSGSPIRRRRFGGRAVRWPGWLRSAGRPAEGFRCACWQHSLASQAPSGRPVVDGEGHDFWFSFAARCAVTTSITLMEPESKGHSIRRYGTDAAGPVLISALVLPLLSGFPQASFQCFPHPHLLPPVPPLRYPPQQPLIPGVGVQAHRR